MTRSKLEKIREIADALPNVSTLEVLMIGYQVPYLLELIDLYQETIENLNRKLMNDE